MKNVINRLALECTYNPHVTGKRQYHIVYALQNATLTHSAEHATQTEWHKRTGTFEMRSGSERMHTWRRMPSTGRNFQTLIIWITVSQKASCNGSISVNNFFFLGFLQFLLCSFKSSHFFLCHSVFPYKFPFKNVTFYRMYLVTFHGRTYTGAARYWFDLPFSLHFNTQL